MKKSEWKNEKESKEKQMEYTVEIHYGTMKLETCIQKFMKSMSMREETDAEKI